MANLMTLRIRTGAPVECTDGRLGTVDRVEQDLDGNTDYLCVRRGWSGQSTLVPVDLIHDVDADGSVLLGCSKDEAETYTPGRAGPARSIFDQRTGRLDSADVEAVGTAEFDHSRPDEWERSQVDGSNFERAVELGEEELAVRKDLRDVGEVRVRTEAEEVPGRLEVEAYREEVDIEHVPVGKVVSERAAPWEEDGVLVVPVYEEQLVVTKRLVLREQLRVRRVAVRETQLFEDTLRRERPFVENPDDRGVVRERFPTGDGPEEHDANRPRWGADSGGDGGWLARLVRRALR